METNSVDVRTKKRIRSKIVDRYNWGALAIGIQQIAGMAIIFGVVGVIALFKLRGTSLKELYPQFLSLLMEYNMVATAFAMTIVNVALAVIIMKVSKTGKVRNYFTKPKIGVLDIILSCLAIIGISAIDGFIMQLLSSVFGSTSEVLGKFIGGSTTSDNTFISVISVIYISLLGPITEEILCRGAIFPAFSHVSTKFGIITSALMFGLMHGNINQLYNAFMLGIILAYTMAKSQSIIPAIFMHIANNCIAVIEGFVPDKAVFYIDLISAIVGVAALVIFIIRNKDIDDTKDAIKVNKPVTDEQMEMLQPVKKNSLTFGAFFSSWAFWCVLIYMLINSISIIFMGKALMG